MDSKNRLLCKRFLLGAAVSIIGTNLIGCGNNNEYTAPKVGTIAYSGEIDYNEFKSIKLIQITNEETEEYEYYLVKVSRNENNTIIYTDIETGINIAYDMTTVIIENVSEYLEANDMVLNKYTVDEIERIKEIIFSDEELNLSKYPENLKRTLKN